MMIKHKRGYSAPPFEVDEAVCEQLCQHPSCWRSTRRLMRGLPRKLVRVEKQDTSGGTSDNEDQELPTQKVCNILDEFGSDPNDRFPSDYKGMPQAYRMDLRKPSDLKPPRRPMVTPATSFEQEVSKPQLRSVEVQELFEMGDLAGTYVDTFVDKPFLVWVPNQRKLAEKEKKKEKMMQDLKDKILQRAQQAGPKDVTEELVPREIEEQREREILQKQILKSSGGKSPTNKQQPYKFTPPRTPRQVPFDTRLFEVFNCSSDVMLRILEHIEKYDLNSKEQIFELLQRLAPENLTPKSKAELALIGNEIMTHQKGPPSERGLAWKSPAAVNNAPPVFYLDEVPTEKSLNSPVYPRYRNPLPAINSGEDYGMKVLKKKVVSLGLPELPPGVSPTRPFRYGKPAENFALEAHSVPSRVGSSHSGYSTSTRGGSPDNMREDTLEQIYVKQYRKNLEKGVPLHAISPADSTKVPHTPLSTPVVKTPTAHASERHGEIQVPKKFQLTQDAFTDAFAAAKSPQVYREKSARSLNCSFRPSHLLCKFNSSALGRFALLKKISCKRYSYNINIDDYYQPIRKRSQQSHQQKYSQNELGRSIALSVGIQCNLSNDTSPYVKFSKFTLPWKRGSPRSGINVSVKGRCNKKVRGVEDMTESELWEKVLHVIPTYYPLKGPSQLLPRMKRRILIDETQRDDWTFLQRAVVSPTAVHTERSVLEKFHFEKAVQTGMEDDNYSDIIRIPTNC